MKGRGEARRGEAKQGQGVAHALPRPAQNALSFWARMHEQSSRFLIDDVLDFDCDQRMQLHRRMMD